MTVDALLITIALMVVHSTLLPSFPPSSSWKTAFRQAIFGVQLLG